jgi:hypothetical protein
MPSVALGCSTLVFASSLSRDQYISTPSLILKMDGGNVTGGPTPPPELPALLHLTIW